MRTFVVALGLSLVGSALVALAPVASADDAPACKPYPCCACSKPEKAACPPQYDNRRFLENWRPCLCVPFCEKGDWSDRLKANRLTRRGTIRVDVGGQIRMRFESWSNAGFGGPAINDDSWLLARARVHTGIHFGNHVRLFVEGIYADQVENRRLPGGPRPIDVNQGDLLNAFAEIKGPIGGCTEAGAYAGRRELQLGKQRLVSPLDWANTRRTFDGAGAWARRGHHRIEGFVATPVVVKPRQLDDWLTDDRLFWGANYTNTRLDCVTWEAYVLGLNDDRVNTRQDRYTAGARADGKIPNTRFDWDVEGAYQFGHVIGDTISAGMFSGTFGWAPCLCWDPRVAIGFDYASGDANGSPTRAGTFNQLFPLAHKYLGHMDLIGRQNNIAGRLEAHVKPTKKLTLSVWLHAFWRAETADAVYNAGGGVLRASGGSTAAEVGQEIDFMIQYKIDRHWTAAFEYGHFFPGSFISQTGPSQGVDFWWVGAQGTF